MNPYDFPLPGCEPLTLTRSIGECLIANRPLREWQETALAKANIAASKAKIAPNLWINTDELAKCGGSDLSNSRRIRYSWEMLDIQEKVLDAITESDIQGDLSPAAHVEGILVLGSGSRVLPGVFIQGTVVAGRDCLIGPNCFLRGRTSIADGCKIGHAVEIKNSILYPGATIGHLSYCGDSIIGANVNFGAGTITANYRHDAANHRSQIGEELVDTGRRKFGTIIGDNVHTGIHTSIYPGRKLWPDTSTLPGEVVRRDIKR